jgi:hypothetical protein
MRHKKRKWAVEKVRFWKGTRKEILKVKIFLPSIAQLGHGSDG